ncbi:hypothetical protein [Paenibacillus sp. N3.4]|nr:hypothetical protein [Paenibacillus sp. N3.4]
MNEAVVEAYTDIKQPYFIVYMSAMIAFMIFKLNDIGDSINENDLQK